jgi:rod shape-determining protein MreD
MIGLIYLDENGTGNIGDVMGVVQITGLMIIFALAQSVFMTRLSIQGVKPELLLILACYFLLLLPPGKALISAFILGLIADAYSLLPFGLTALSFMLIAAVLISVREEFLETNVYTWIVILTGASAFDHLLHLAVLRLILAEPVPVTAFIGKLPLLVLINTLTGLCLFPILSRSRIRWKRTEVRENLS